MPIKMQDLVEIYNFNIDKRRKTRVAIYKESCIQEMHK